MSSVNFAILDYCSLISLNLALALNDKHGDECYIAHGSFRTIHLAVKEPIRSATVAFRLPFPTPQSEQIMRMLLKLRELA
jgi:hypothetical protein